jgi:hypothetical protein
LPSSVELENASGSTNAGEPYIRIFLKDGVLQPDQRITQRLVFRNAGRRLPLAYEVTLLSGQGVP